MTITVFNTENYNPGLLIFSTLFIIILCDRVIKEAKITDIERFSLARYKSLEEM